MAAKYRRVNPRIWHDEKFSQLPPNDKLIALYCLTGPQTNRVGIYVLSVAMGSEDTAVETFGERLAVICETLGWGFDLSTRTLYLPTWWRYQRPDNPNVFVKCLGDLDDLPQSALLKEFMENTKYLPETFVRKLRNVTPNVSPQEQEQEQEQKQEQERLLERDSDEKNGNFSPNFLDFMTVYPRDIGRAEAAVEYDLAIARIAERPSAPVANASTWLRNRAMAFRNSEFGRSGKAWFPAIWLKDAHYDDDPAAWSPGKPPPSKPRKVTEEEARDRFHGRLVAEAKENKKTGQWIMDNINDKIPELWDEEKKLQAERKTNPQPQ